MGIWTSTAADWKRILYGLLPEGVVWTQEEARRLTRLIAGISDEFVRVHTRAGTDMMDEADPQTTTEMLEDWERVCGLPEFGHVPTAVADRREVLLGKLAAQGGCSLDYFQDLAESYGATGVTTSDGWRILVWTVEMQAGDLLRACCTSSCDAALVEFLTPVADRIARAFTHYKPSHTAIFWDGGIAP